jgi:hypothetical protein
MRAKDAGAVPPRSGLRSLKFKCRYKSPADNILDDFLVPVLSASKHYYRVAGFFSSSVLSAAARGVAAFVESGEKMQLIVGGILYEEDVEAISRGHTTEHEVLEKNLGTALENLEDALIRKRLEVLAWLVSVEKLEIRVAIPLAPDGSLIPSNQAYWHEKFAVFEDHSGDRIQIEGSINESETGWRENSEAFSVHKSWIDGQSEYVQDSLSEFVDLFRGHAKHCLVMNLPTAARKALLKYRPSEAPSGEPRRTSTLIETIAQDLGGLWPHQRKAFECWLANGQRGILAMATGSGKTRASMACIRFAAEHRPIVLILVPKLGLMKQWEMEVRRVWPDSSVILCSGETDWRTTLPPRLLVSEGLTFLISTMQTACGRDLKPMVTKLVSPSRLFLVVDEVHHIGAPAYSNVLTWCHPELGRLGLSATPERAWDSIGTERTFSYFDGVVYEYGIGEAIRDGYLSKYQYFPRFVSLSDSEL